MKKTIKYSPFYRTKDQFLASTLYALGEKIDSTERLDNECFFVFENKEKCEEVVKKYYAGELKVDPKGYANAFKDIKSIIFNS